MKKPSLRKGRQVAKASSFYVVNRNPVFELWGGKLLEAGQGQGGGGNRTSKQATDLYYKMKKKYDLPPPDLSSARKTLPGTEMAPAPWRKIKYSSCSIFTVFYLVTISEGIPLSPFLGGLCGNYSYPFVGHKIWESDKIKHLYSRGGKDVLHIDSEGLKPKVQLWYRRNCLVVLSVALKSFWVNTFWAGHTDVLPSLEKQLSDDNILGLTLS